MRILVCDRLLVGKPHSDWKEGWEIFYAFNKIGIECDIAGPGCPIHEKFIPEIQSHYDLIIVTENYPQNDNAWSWWNWSAISTKKMFWAIDTHTNDFRNWLIQSKFDFVGLNNKQDIEKYHSLNRFYFPYVVSSKHYSRKLGEGKKYEAVFIGSLTPERKQTIDKFKIKHITAFGWDYVKTMQESKICFNQSISYDLNAKNFKILAAGSFMLSNYNEAFSTFIGHNEDIEKMIWKTEDELKIKLEHYLSRDDEREAVIERAQSYIINHHSYEARCKILAKGLL